MSKNDREHFQVAYINGNKKLWEETVMAKQDANRIVSQDERLDR